jgi:hypothetical protein
MKHITCLTAALILSACGGGSSNEPITGNLANNTTAQPEKNVVVTDIQRPSYRVGQSWTYLYTESQADGTTKAVTPTYTVTSVNQDGSYTISYGDPTGYFTNGIATYNSAHALMSDTVGDKPNLCVNSPPTVEVKFPLNSNTKWDNDTSNTCADGSIMHIVTNHATSTQTPITVEAGTFNGGYMIDVSGSITISPGVVSPTSMNYYYAPSVGTVVYRKTTINGFTATSELVSFVP